MSDATQKDYLSLPAREFLQDLGSNSSTPGGGSAAALTGSIGVNLGHMVATFALKRAQKQGRRRSRSSTQWRGWSAGRTCWLA